MTELTELIHQMGVSRGALEDQLTELRGTVEKMTNKITILESIIYQLVEPNDFEISRGME